MKYGERDTSTRQEKVAPFAGARIEILMKDGLDEKVASLPSRERGLKSIQSHLQSTVTVVAPFAGARIEIRNMPKQRYVEQVAPFAGARIEIVLFE